MRNVEDGQAFEDDAGYLVTRLDLMDAASIDAAVAAATQRFGTIDVLLNDESLAEYQPMVQALQAAMQNMDTSGQGHEVLGHVELALAGPRARAARDRAPGGRRPRRVGGDLE